MKMIKVFLMALAVVVLLAFGGEGGAVLATDYEWLGSFVGDPVWSGISNWDPTGYPDDNTDNAFIINVVESNTCVFDLQNPLEIQDLHIAGDSPTKMTLNVSASPLTIGYFTEYLDYSALDCDDDFESHREAELSGNIWVNVVNGVYCLLCSNGEVVGNEISSNISCFLDIEDHTSGICEAINLLIDSSTENVARGLKITGTGSKLLVTGYLRLVGEQSTMETAHKAKLWIGGANLVIDNGGDGFAYLDLDGGPTSTRRAEVDADRTGTAEAAFATGHVRIDVAEDNIVYMGVYQIGDGSAGETIVTVTGDGGHVQSGVCTTGCP